MEGMCRDFLLMREVLSEPPLAPSSQKANLPRPLEDPLPRCLQDLLPPPSPHRAGSSPSRHSSRKMDLDDYTQAVDINQITKNRGRPPSPMQEGKMPQLDLGMSDLTSFDSPHLLPQDSSFGSDSMAGVSDQAAFSMAPTFPAASASYDRDATFNTFSYDRNSDRLTHMEDSFAPMGVAGVTEVSMDSAYLGDVTSSSEGTSQWPVPQVGGMLGGLGEDVNPMVTEEDSIKQEEDLFSNLSVGPANHILPHHPPLGSSSSTPAGNSSLGTVKSSHRGGAVSGRGRRRGTNSPATGSYSPSSTAPIQSELDYGEYQEELHPASPHLKYTSTSAPSHHPASPPSPERHFCSSTTSLAGDSNANNAEEEDTPRKMCLVCGDIASGFHYGVASCEACKAFFKRTIQGNIEYTCPATRDCEINKKRRKACQSCRFSKCLAVGMLKEGVRLDRVRGGRQKYRRTSENTFNPISVGTRRLDDLKMLVSLRSCEPECSPGVVDSSSEITLIGTLAEFYDRELVATIGWAKLVPGFTEIVLDDQMRLLQSTWGEILTLGLAYRSMSCGSSKLHFAPDLIVDTYATRELQAYDLHCQVLSIVERFDSLNLHHDEYLLMKALVLANSDVRLQDMAPLQALRDNVMQTLMQAVENIRSQDVSKHFSALLLTLPALRSADSTLRKFWLSIRERELVPMNKLFREMLESNVR